VPWYVKDWVNLWPTITAAASGLEIGYAKAYSALITAELVQCTVDLIPPLFDLCQKFAAISQLDI
jgi:hypothetical protein